MLKNKDENDDMWDEMVVVERKEGDVYHAMQSLVQRE